jgi:hypothetical protein
MNEYVHLSVSNNLLQPTFARVPWSSVERVQGFVLSVCLVASVRADKGG